MRARERGIAINATEPCRYRDRLLCALGASFAPDSTACVHFKPVSAQPLKQTSRRGSTAKILALHSDRHDWSRSKHSSGLPAFCATAGLKDNADSNASAATVARISIRQCSRISVAYYHHGLT
jgi:hypothetical protein